MGVKKEKNGGFEAVLMPIMFLTNVLLINPFISGYKDMSLSGFIQDIFSITKGFCS
ncbi:hypothetical protein ABIE26_002218 [Pedobacter africanus]|uniref:Uncharacterized protein n=1 Tax=Pedobacter africanus TaxID=151894 RepID=A0ACC6KYD7_9SPHI|nr:hypothetical protein [Pedobacter africanus]MDR6784393.1 hypothetical protein [Pedobacter africanus]